jgi:hypothetical protein
MGALPVVEGIFERRVRWRRHLSTAAVVAPTLVAAAAVGYWQMQDAIYRASSGAFFGSQQLSVFWYPLTLGAVAVLALRGAQQWARVAHPYRFSLLAWIGAVIVLHTSSLINGYHFVFHLHLPLCILAAPALREMIESLGSAGFARRARAATLLLALLPSFLLVTRESIVEVTERNLAPRDYFAVVRTLAARPAGNALVPLDELATVLAEQNIRYLVVESTQTPALREALGDWVEEQVPHATLDLLVLR